MKKIIAYFRDGKFEELLGVLAIITVIIPVIINIPITIKNTPDTILTTL